MSAIIYPEIIRETIESNKVSLELFMPESLHYFKGHFPVAAILPGVAQANWAMEYIEQYLGYKASAFNGFTGLKFQQIIAPNYQVELTLERINENKAKFSYSSEHGQHASGKVLYNHA